MKPKSVRQSVTRPRDRLCSAAGACCPVEVLDELLGHLFFLIEAVVDIENLAMAEHLDLMMHYKAENLLLSLPRKWAAGIHPSSCATVAVWEIQVPGYAINDCLQKVCLLVGSVELEGEVLPANHLEPRLASLPRFRSLLASPPTTSARTVDAVVAIILWFQPML